MNRKTLWKLLAVLVILAGSISWYFWWQREDAGRHAISVVGLNGTALVERSGMKISAYEGMKLKDGDSIYAESGQEAILGIDGIPFAVLEMGTKLSIEQIKEETNGTRIQMEGGSVLFLSDATLSGEASRQAAELLLFAGGLQIDANGASFYIAVEGEGEAKQTALSVWSGRVMAVPLAGGKEESIAAGMTATFLLDEKGVSSRGQKAFTLLQFSEHVLEKLLVADKAQSPFCFSREELAWELEGREAVVAGTTGRITDMAEAFAPAVASGTLLPSSGAASPMPTSGTATPSSGEMASPAPTSGTATPSSGAASPVPTSGTATPSSGEMASPAPPSAAVLSPSPSVGGVPSAVPEGGAQVSAIEPTKPPQTTGEPTPILAKPQAPAADSVLGSKFTELIGQTPEVDASDGVLTYYEFAMGMLAAAEPKLAASGASVESVLMGFAFRLITGGVDINRLDVNEPMTRGDAALFLWYGAQSIGDMGAADISDTTAYVEDISGCALAKQKAIGFLYKEGYEEGYQEKGQKFCPEEVLTTEEGEEWIRISAERWKEN